MSDISASVNQTKKLVSALMRSFQTPYASEVLYDAIKGDKTCMPDPTGYLTAKKFAVDYQAYNVLRKMEDDLYGHRPSDESLIEKSVSGFLEVEKRMDYVNQKGYIPGTAPSSEMLAPEQIFHLARRKIADVLGEFSPDEMVECANFSSGASTRLPRKRGAPMFKFQGKPHVTRNCALLSVCMLWHSPVWREYCQSLYGRNSDPFTWVKVVRGSEYFTVPKTFDSVRGAAKEPCLNMMLQKGIGTMIRSRLKRVDIDLNDQTRNQYLARCGSTTGSLATIDLAAASDSISLLMLDLLPYQWARFIRLTRSEEIKLPDGRWHTLSKVSSMGNGFTFELESLIFWALTSATVSLKGLSDRRIGVYGDDIICHHVCAPDLINCLASFGFETNVEKTWVQGPFRESCGKHWFYGVDVSPFNVKSLITEGPEAYHYVNRLRLWAFRTGVDLDRKTLRYTLAQLFPRGYNCVPPHLGTKAGMLVPSIADATGVFFCLRKQRYTSWAYQRVVRQEKGDGFPAYLSWLHRPTREVVIRPPGERKSDRYRRKSYGSSEWSDCEIGLVETV